ncbi:AtpZ/AtpI family protein [Candidatus Saccharibacteria bacterium]|jgi:hypothetical protein|nr:AtpZ/AtpI family protein [Candidatus Saccharibacteria bacterium]
MKKTKVSEKTKPVTTNTVSEMDQVVDRVAKQMAGQRILGSLVGMGWRLAIAVIVPIIVGLQIDKHLETGKRNTFGGFILAICLSSYMIYKEYQQIQSNVPEFTDTKAKKSQEKR